MQRALGDRLASVRCCSRHLRTQSPPAWPRMRRRGRRRRRKAEVTRSERRGAPAPRPLHSPPAAVVAAMPHQKYHVVGPHSQLRPQLLVARRTLHVNIAAEQRREPLLREPGAHGVASAAEDGEAPRGHRSRARRSRLLRDSGNAGGGKHCGGDAESHSHAGGVRVGGWEEGWAHCFYKLGLSRAGLARHPRQRKE